MINKKFALGLISGLSIAVLATFAQDFQIPEGSGGSGSGQNADNKLIRVCTLSSIQANQEFQRNVQILQAQRQRAVELNTLIEESTGSELQKHKRELDNLMTKLNENNQKMVETYGFSLTRNYTMVIEKSHVYMFVSPDEAAKYEEAVKNGTTRTVN